MPAWYRFWVTAVVVLLSTGVASAGDFCFNSTSPPNPAPLDNPDILVIAQRFHLPSKGKCSAIVGWDTGLSNGVSPSPASGTACLNSAGTTLSVGVTIHTEGPGGTEAVNLKMSLEYPSLTGVIFVDRLSHHPEYDLNFARADVFAGPCNGIPIP
jgi:hypothetical protein